MAVSISAVFDDPAFAHVPGHPCALTCPSSNAASHKGEPLSPRATKIKDAFRVQKKAPSDIDEACEMAFD